VADGGVATRIAGLSAGIGEAFTRRVLDRAGVAADRAFVAQPEVADLVAAFGLRSPREAAILALPAAAALADPPISGYRVGAVGLTEAGELVLGGNLEFSGASIHHTVHAEGFVALRARALGRPLAALAITQARPCAHCRQVLAEMAWADGLRLVDPLGHDLALADLYPWPFTPGDLGRAGAGSPDGADGDHGTATGPGEPAPCELRPDPSLPPAVAAALEAAGRRAHAPYSGEPSAVVIRLGDGRLVGGAVLESVAFNPTIGPLQDALVGLAAAGVASDRAAEVWLGVAAEGRVEHERPVRDLLAAVAPAATLHITYWA
jgi:cytidine deaminase